MSLDWSRREGESKLRVLPTVGGYARLMMRQVRQRAARSAVSVGIVGGGLLGLTAAYRLAAAGVPVTVYEASGQRRRARRHHASAGTRSTATTTRSR